MTTTLIVVLKKMTHNSLIFKLFNTLVYVNIPIKFTYVCRLFCKNLLCNMGCHVSYLTRHKKFITSSMLKYT
jgi:hypothetical protein